MKLAAKLLFVAGLTWIVWRNLDLDSVQHVITWRAAIGILLAQPVILGAVAIMGMRHGLLARVPPVPLSICFPAMILFIGLNFIFPARAAEVIKSSYLFEHASVPVSDGIAATVVGHLFDLIVLAILGLTSVVLGTGINEGRAILWGGVLVIAAGATLAIPVLPRLRFGRFAATRLGRLTVGVFQSAASRFLPSLVLGAWLLTLAYWALAFVGMAIVLTFSSQTIDLRDILLAFVGSLVGGVVSILPNGIGTYEAGIMIPLMMKGADFSTALAIALIVRIGVFISPVAIALFLMIRKSTGVLAMIESLRKS